MISGVDSSVSFGAKFDPETSKRILNHVKNDPRMTRCVEHWLEVIEGWGDKNSVISMKKVPFTDKDQFVLRNENLGGDKEIVLSRHISAEDSPLLIAFFDVTKQVIRNAEKLLIRD